MTTNENNFKNKCKNMRELFFGKRIFKTFLSANKELIYIIFNGLYFLLIKS